VILVLLLLEGELNKDLLELFIAIVDEELLKAVRLRRRVVVRGRVRRSEKYKKNMDMVKAWRLEKI
jgi:hypothetical protein